MKPYMLIDRWPLPQERDEAEGLALLERGKKQLRDIWLACWIAIFFICVALAYRHQLHAIWSAL